MRFDPVEKPGVSNLLQILAATSNREIPDVEAEFAGGGYGALKAAVAEAVVEFVRPLQARYAELDRDPAEVDRIVAAGAARAEEISAPVIARVRNALGLMPRARDSSSLAAAQGTCAADARSWRASRFARRRGDLGAASMAFRQSLSAAARAVTTVSGMASASHVGRSWCAAAHCAASSGPPSRRIRSAPISGWRR